VKTFVNLVVKKQISFFTILSIVHPLDISLTLDMTVSQSIQSFSPPSPLKGELQTFVQSHTPHLKPQTSNLKPQTQYYSITSNIVHNIHINTLAYLHIGTFSSILKILKHFSKNYLISLSLQHA